MHMPVCMSYAYVHVACLCARAEAREAHHESPSIPFRVTPLKHGSSMKGLCFSLDWQPAGSNSLPVSAPLCPGLTGACETTLTLSHRRGDLNSGSHVYTASTQLQSHPSSFPPPLFETGSSHVSLAVLELVM